MYTTRMLAAAIFCTLEKHLFDETTPRAEVATSFCITAAQFHKSVTGIDYQSNPHADKKQRKTMDTASTTTINSKDSHRSIFSTLYIWRATARNATNTGNISQIQR